MFPLLALGLMGGGLAGADWYQKAMQSRSEQAGADQVQSLLGSAPREMGPPTEEGTMGQMPGQGLLGNMGDPATQAKFMQGLLTLPAVQRQQASQMYGDLFRRVQEGNQFQQGEKRLTDQFGRTEARLGDQFRQEFDQRGAQYGTTNNQWQQTFDASRQEAAQRLAIERARLGLEQSRANAKGANNGLPELPKGWGYTQSARGIVAAPMPGTKDFMDVSLGERSLNDSIGNIDRFLDVYAGKQQGPNGVRVGGAGDQYLNSDAGSTMSTIRGAIFADMGKLYNLGVLQPADQARLDKLLADPTSAGNFVKSRSSVVKAYEELRSEFARKLDAHREANPWLLPPPPPGALIDGAPGSKPSNAPPSRPSGSGGGNGPGTPSSAPQQVGRRGMLMFPGGE